MPITRSYIKGESFSHAGPSQRRTRTTLYMSYVLRSFLLYMRPSREVTREWLLAVVLLLYVTPCASCLATGAARNSELGSGWRRDPTASGLSLGNQLARNSGSCSQQSHCLRAVGAELRGGSEPSTKGRNTVPGAALYQLLFFRVSPVVHDRACCSVYQRSGLLQSVLIV